jgi:hypothetical protein
MSMLVSLARRGGGHLAVSVGRIRLVRPDASSVCRLADAVGLIDAAGLVGSPSPSTLSVGSRPRCRIRPVAAACPPSARRPRRARAATRKVPATALGTDSPKRRSGRCRRCAGSDPRGARPCRLRPPVLNSRLVRPGGRAAHHVHGVRRVRARRGATCPSRHPRFPFSSARCQRADDRHLAGMAARRGR